MRVHAWNDVGDNDYDDGATPTLIGTCNQSRARNTCRYSRGLLHRLCNEIFLEISSSSLCARREPPLVDRCRWLPRTLIDDPTTYSGKVIRAINSRGLSRVYGKGWSANLPQRSITVKIEEAIKRVSVHEVTTRVGRLNENNGLSQQEVKDSTKH